MLIASVPTRIGVVWGASAGGSYIHTVPVASQIGITNGAASFTDGFVPLNFVAVASGGVPPFGQDFNGVLKQITQWNQWQAAGAPVTYNSAFSTAVGGYPSGAILISSSLNKFWMSTADNNTTDPDGGSPANWVQIYGQIPTLTIWGNNTGSTGYPTPLTVAQVNTMLGTGFPVGSIIMYSINAAPTGWLICDGSTVLRSSALGTALVSAGSPYGAGNGTTTVNIPNMLGQFPRGFDSVGSVDPARTFGSTQGHAMQSHNHGSGVGLVADTVAWYGGTNTNIVLNGHQVGTQASQASTQGYTSTGSPAASGGTGSPVGTFAAETRPTNIALTFLIKT